MPHGLCHMVYIPHGLCHMIFATRFSPQVFRNMFFATWFMPHGFCQMVFVKCFSPHGLCHRCTYCAPQFLHQDLQLGAELGPHADEVEFTGFAAAPAVVDVIEDLLDQRVLAVHYKHLQRHVQGIVVLLNELHLQTQEISLIKNTSSIYMKSTNTKNGLNKEFHI